MVVWGKGVIVSYDNKYVGPRFHCRGNLIQGFTDYSLEVVGPNLYLTLIFCLKVVRFGDSKPPTHTIGVV